MIIHETQSVKRRRLVFSKDRMILFMMAVPFIVLIFMFSYVPLFGWAAAFLDYKLGIPFSKAPFVGFKYFALLGEYHDDIFRVLRNTFGLGFLGILASPLPAVMAILLNEIKSSKFKRLVQTLTTIPNFISWVIVYGLAFSILSNEGMLNTMLMNLGIIKSPTNILGNSDMVWIFQTLLSIWKGLGWGCIIYLAAIAGIDAELYSAASVDGAGRFRCIWHITVPGLIPTFIVLLILSISSILSVGFEQYFVFNNPMVADNIEVLDLFLYRIGLVTNDISFATAIGILKSFVSIVFLVTANLLAKKSRGYGIF